MRRVVRLLTAIGEDRFGKRTFAAPVSLGSCVVAPGGSSESDDRGTTVDTTWTVYAPFITSISPNDRLEVGEFGVFEVFGMPSPWQSPFSGRKAGTEITIRKVVG